MEADLTEAPIYSSNIEDAALSEAENADESMDAVAKASNDMQIYFKEEQNTE